VGPVTGTANPQPIRAMVAVGALVVFAVAAGIAWELWVPKERQPVFVPSSDYSALVGLLLSAAAIERFLEPFSPWLLSKKAEKATETEKAKDAVTAAEDPEVPVGVVAAAADEAAAAKATVARKESERAVVHWAVASVVSLAAPALLGVFFLRSVSAGATPPNRFLDMVFTALIVGAGTKPLHDTISIIQAKKKSAEAAAEET
jgi:hypothetical protein